MSRHYPNKKREANSLCRIDVFWLKKHKYLDFPSQGFITWSQPSTIRSAVKVQVFAVGENKYMQLSYKIGPGNSKTKFMCKYELTTTPCNYGGGRYWFICITCNRRIGVLYFGKTLFLCRHCLNLSYESKNENRRGKYYLLARHWGISQKIDALRVKYNRGSPTKRYQRLLNKRGYLSPKKYVTLLNEGLLN